MKRVLPLALWVAVMLGAPAIAVALDAPVVERAAPDRLVVRWQGRDPVDVYASARPDAPIGSARRLARADRNGAFALQPAGADRTYFILRDERTGAVVRVAERQVPLERGSNFRDLGGYRAAGGRHVRWGMIYRTAATPMLTDADFAQVARLGLTADIDLRSLEERQLAPDRAPLRTGARYFASDYPGGPIFSGLAKGGPGGTASYYRTWLISLAPQYRAIFQNLLRGDGAVAFHCSAGQDRSGVAAALILSALGVSRPVILEDYQLSTADRRPDNEMPPIDPARHPGNPVAQFYARVQAAGPIKARPLYDASGQAFLLQTFDEIDSRWGSVDAYLDRVLGIGPRDVARLRRLYLE